MYKRVPLLKLPSIQTRALIMGRYGMLDCKTNYAVKYGGKNCLDCNMLDDEAHRINDCVKYSSVNRCDGN